MLSLLKKIKINPLFWFVIGIGILTGYFKEVIMVFSIVFIHEMGHSIAAHFFKWRIRKIELLPFGGVAEVEEYGNRPLKEEFIVIISGPIQHIWLIVLSFLLLPFDFWTSNDHQMFITHNLMILLFNLLPIWPLDGGKLMYLFFSTKYSFQRSLETTLRSSLLLLAIFTITSIYFFPFHLNLWIVIIFLLFSHYFDWKQRSYAYMRFLMERYYKTDEPFVATVPIGVSPQLTVQEVLKTFRRGVKHKVVLNDLSVAPKKSIYEKVILKAFFEQKMASQPIAKLTPP
ncbi:M50 family metallopeptidase [Anaerobacillus isosaccharinicus]|uniref:M50 family metallopeptidase n=1 Tax=Anaerobacillus isosaccharinicus TaxID=1532552 RepID=A0A1S2MG61_9BACI|nr:M50 family metallopeptidase [Anaerobacillus isosaccharinicus]MBA5587808.1 M50 family metallopeptidase [Anaerobacillus isosaccharinicus]QOY38627.1 M50 family metallopeptidase [Anaerobacillus isosaccharinicus]